MRISTDKNDPGYATWDECMRLGRSIEVTIDGRLAKNVITADTETGDVIFGEPHGARFHENGDVKISIDAPKQKREAVNHPEHYNANPSGIECIDVVEHMSFNVGNAMKYLWRADFKADAIEDLRKAAWYIQRELKKRGAA